MWVMDTDSAKMLFGVENAVGKTFRTTLYGSTDDYTVVGVYKKEINAFQALMMGSSNNRGSAFLPYTLLTWPNDTFYQLRMFGAENMDMDQFVRQFKLTRQKCIPGSRRICICTQPCRR